MPPFKKQHFLPSSYLKYFSDDQMNCGRKSCTWRFDGKEMRRVPVESQGFENYFYSKEKAAETERLFQPREEIYCHFVDQIRLGKEPPRKSFGDFFLCMFDLHLRNAAHKNLTSGEGVSAYQARLTMFFSQLLVGGDHADCTIPKVKDHIQTHWRMEIIPAPPEYQFLTSDHPSIFMTCTHAASKARNALQMILLPVDPLHTAVAFDRRFISLRNQVATPSDVQTLNVGQVQNCEKCVYSSDSIDDNDRQSLAWVFKTKKASSCEVTDKGWKLTTAYLPPENHFSFMQAKPLLF